MTPCIWLGTTHPCNLPNYGLWVNLQFFMMWIYKHCFLPMLLVSAMKCCTKMPCPLPQPLLLLASFTYMLGSLAHLYMPHLFTHCLPTIICVMLMSIAFFYFLLFLLYATFLCDSILACLCTYFLFRILAYIIYLLIMYGIVFSVRLSICHMHFDHDKRLEKNHMDQVLSPPCCQRKSIFN